MPRRVAALRRLGFDGAVALQEALGVPSAGEAEGEGGGDPRRRARGGETLQGEMVGKRQALADTFAAVKPGGGASSVPLLVTTEHSARGIDLKGVDAVFLVGLPQRLESYVHVAGRTAREGRKGRAVCLLTEDAEIERLAAFGHALGVKVESIDVRFLGK